ncbi:unnamed protein product [Periconia digitata]|uniref:Uncharacterized protein n=1 Tax=Periconia digitata TaxID=1303443 RepID=A0A9W4U8G1_9PLEO|nr:unnamed protein product [Periconia digitata]
MSNRHHRLSAKDLRGDECLVPDKKKTYTNGQARGSQAKHALFWRVSIATSATPAAISGIALVLFPIVPGAGAICPFSTPPASPYPFVCFDDRNMTSKLLGRPL